MQLSRTVAGRSASSAPATKPVATSQAKLPAQHAMLLALAVVFATGVVCVCITSGATRRTKIVHGSGPAAVSMPQFKPTAALPPSCTAVGDHNETEAPYSTCIMWPQRKCSAEDMRSDAAKAAQARNVRKHARCQTRPIVPGLLAEQLPQTALESCIPSMFTGVQWQSRGCRVRNLCYDVVERQFLWNAAGSMPPINGLMFSLLGDTAHARRNGDREKMSFTSTDGLRTSKPESVTIFSGMTVLLTKRYSPHNAGHLLMQTILALERLANDFGVANRSDRLVLFDDSCWDTDSIKWVEGNSTSRRRQCTSFTQAYAAVLSLAPPLLLSEMAARAGPAEGHREVEWTHPDHSALNQWYSAVAGSRYVCFDDVLGGVGRNDPWGMHWKTQWQDSHRWLSPYREKAFEHFNIPSNGARPKGCNLVFLKKEYGARRGLHNYDELDHFMDGWAREHGSTYESMVLSNVSFEHQLRSVASADIMVSVGGSTAFAAFFLRPGSQLVYFPLLGLAGASKVAHVANAKESDLLSGWGDIEFHGYIDHDTDLTSKPDRFFNGPEHFGIVVSIDVLRKMLDGIASKRCA